jgi:hypothetical protein
MIHQQHSLPQGLIATPISNDFKKSRSRRSIYQSLLISWMKALVVCSAIVLVIALLVQQHVSNDWGSRTEFASTLQPPSKQRFRLAVVGAGASGLSMTRDALEEENMDVVVFERQSHVGGLWSGQLGKTFRSLRSNVPRDLMTLRGMDALHNASWYPTRAEVSEW